MRKVFEQISFGKSLRLGDNGFATTIFEHDGKKFKVYTKATGDEPCATYNTYCSLQVMTSDGTWKVVEDYKSVGASYTPRHFCYKSIEECVRMYNENLERFVNYIKMVY